MSDSAEMHPDISEFALISLLHEHGESIFNGDPTRGRLEPAIEDTALPLAIVSALEIRFLLLKVKVVFHQRGKGRSL